MFNNVDVTEILRTPNITCWFDSSNIKGLVNKNTNINNGDLIGGSTIWNSLVGNSRLIKFPTPNCKEGEFVSVGSLGKPSVRLNNTQTLSTNVPTLMLDSFGDTLYSSSGSTTIIACNGPVNYGNGFIWNGDMSGFYSGAFYSIGGSIQVATGYGFKYGRNNQPFTSNRQYQRIPKFTMWISNNLTKTDLLYSLENSEYNSRVDTLSSAVYLNNNPASSLQNTSGNRNVFYIGPWGSTFELGNTFTVGSYQGTMNIEIYEFGVINRLITEDEINLIRTYFKTKYNI
jgi:hypothetical protein